MIKINSAGHYETIGTEPINELWVYNFHLKNNQITDKKELVIDSFPSRITENNNIIPNTQIRYKAHIEDLKEYTIASENVDLISTYGMIMDETIKMLMRQNTGLTLSMNLQLQDAIGVPSLEHIDSIEDAISITALEHIDSIEGVNINKLWVSDFKLENVYSSGTGKKRLFIDSFPYTRTDNGKIIADEGTRYKAYINDLDKYISENYTENAALLATYYATQERIVELLNETYSSIGLDLSYTQTFEV